ncbi:hypothetical protein PR202_gb23818 [Eleusine coracana subsp. coracana]|uniref:Uncharacterized protein n=1 Tax=Eleusine coracana subsp. coracana TaxID=191504 RepID=A0AAV5FL07_ELECO|nr:hypothetical protein PR202_gb23818 [Eleusine coracana subsp. coracana]
MCRQYIESASGSKTLAEMFALSDSGRLKLNSGSPAEMRHSKFGLHSGNSKEGCFIVLPKHAPPVSLQSSVDRDACLEGPSKGRNDSLTTSISYNNGNFRLDSFRDQTSLIKQIGNSSEDNLKNPCNSKCLMADNFSSPDCLNEKVLFTTDEDMVRHCADSKASAFDLQLARKQKAKRLQFNCHEYESMSLSDHADGTKSCKGLKEVEQPSPVSILEPLTDEDSSGYFKCDLQEIASK